MNMIQALLLFLCGLSMVAGFGMVGPQHGRVAARPGFVSTPAPMVGFQNQQATPFVRSSSKTSLNVMPDTVEYGVELVSGGAMACILTYMSPFGQEHSRALASGLERVQEDIRQDTKRKLAYYAAKKQAQQQLLVLAQQAEPENTVAVAAAAIVEETKVKVEQEDMVDAANKRREEQEAEQERIQEADRILAEQEAEVAKARAKRAIAKAKSRSIAQKVNTKKRSLATKILQSNAKTLVTSTAILVESRSIELKVEAKKRSLATNLWRSNAKTLVTSTAILVLRRFAQVLIGV
jgi:hypothetical protein